MLAVCLGCGGSSSETPPPLEPDPKRLLPTVEEPGKEGPAPAAPGAAPAAGPAAGGGAAAAPSGPGVVEDGAEFGIESTGGAHPGTPARAGSLQTWGSSSAPAAPARPKRPSKAP
jgi:hypothetical protein